MGKLDVAKLYKNNAALKRIATMLEEAFNSVGERIRADLLKAYRGYAKGAFSNFISNIKTGSGELRRDRFGRQEFGDWHTYADYKGSTYRPFQTWEDMRAVVGNFSLTYKYADRDANDAYENARDSFVHKNLGKLSNVLGDRQDLKNAVIKFDWLGGYFKGNLQVYLEGAYFRGDIDIKYVVRTIPNVTPYYQYPLVFIEAEVGGKHYKRPSEEELRLLLGATKSAAEEKRELAAAAGVCPMSGKPVPSELLKGLYNRMAVYVKCPTCGAVASVNKQSWNFRQHKTPGSERAGAAAKLETAGYCPMSREKVPAEVVSAMGPVEPYKDPKGFCPGCRQQVRLDARKEWIPAPTKDQYPTQMKVESAKYYKHKLK